MKKLTRSKYNIVARLFVTYSNTHPQVGVMFSIVHKDGGSDQYPRFLDEYDLKPEVNALKHIETAAQTDINHFMDESERLYGYKITVSDRKSLGVDEVHALSKALKSLDKKLSKLKEEHGYPECFQQHLEYLFEALGVDVIWFETLSEEKHKARTTPYCVDDLPMLLREGYQLLVIQNGWLKAS